jgi:LysM repeat protein
MTKSTKMQLMAVLTATLAVSATGQGQENFMRQQAYQEMQRVLGQLEVIQNNLDDLSRRVSRLESGSGGQSELKAEIASLKSSLQQLRRDQDSQRTEIVNELSSKIAKMTIGERSERKPVPAKKVYSGPHLEYTVQSGDSLYLISKAFNVSVKEIKEMNSLKNDNLKVGQKISIPKK